MPNLIKVILEGSPIEIRDAVHSALNETVEANLQETKKAVTAKIFGGAVQVSETVTRKPWSKQSIRETLEEAMLNKGRVENFNEASSNGTPSSHHPLHKVAIAHGFKHSDKGPNSHGYKHGKEHYLVLHKGKGFTLLTGSPAKQIVGKDTQDLATAFVKHGI